MLFNGIIQKQSMDFGTILTISHTLNGLTGDGTVLGIDELEVIACL
jgi:hypothetical protein